MKSNDREFIREILSSDFKKISNPGFTRETLEKIPELTGNKIRHNLSGDIIFLIPQILYASLLILLSFFNTVMSWTQSGANSSILYSTERIIEMLLNPVMISILFAFSLLYIVDLYLKRVSS